MTLGVLLKLRLYPLNLKQLGLAQGMCNVKKFVPDRLIVAGFSYCLSILGIEPPAHSTKNQGGFLCCIKK